MLKILFLCFFLILIASSATFAQQPIKINVDDIRNLQGATIDPPDAEGWSVVTISYSDLLAGSGVATEYSSGCSGTLMCCMTCVFPRKERICVVNIPNNCSCDFDADTGCLSIYCPDPCWSPVVCCGQHE